MIKPRSKVSRFVALIVLIIPTGYPLLAVISALLRREHPPGTTTMIGVIVALLTYINWVNGPNIGIPFWVLVLTSLLTALASNFAAYHYDPNNTRYGRSSSSSS